MVAEQIGGCPKFGGLVGINYRDIKELFYFSDSNKGVDIFQHSSNCSTKRKVFSISVVFETSRLDKTFRGVHRQEFRHPDSKR